VETILKAFKYRLYPNSQQEVLLNKHFGCNRWIYNYALDKKTKSWKEHQVNLSRFDIQKDLPSLKQQEETQWLSEVNAQSLQASLENLDRAYKNFFRTKTGFPKFKSKHNKQSFRIPQYVKVDWEKGQVSAPRIQPIKMVVDRIPEGQIKSATISKTPTGKFFVSVLIDTGLPIPQKQTPCKETAIGIDLGLKDVVVLSNGEKIQNPKYLKSNLYRLKKLQRQASSKTKGSNNRRKANKRVATQYEKITNLRNDFLHKLSTKLIRENQTICLEDLNVRGMMQNHKLAQGISDVAWGRFGEMLKYKSEWNGKNVLTIGRFDPSSKMCSKCGQINYGLTLKDREWTCVCGVKHDRDVNAGINIKDFAFGQLEKLGAERPDVKPVENIRRKRSSSKQETAGSLAQR